MKYIIAKSKDGEIRIPVYDVRQSPMERNAANQSIKFANGNMSKYIPPKYSFGVFGPKKY